MPAETTAVPIAKGTLWTGRIMSTIPISLVAFGSILKLMKTPQVLEGVARTGYPESLIVPVGIIELTCVVMYLIPRTSVLGAILLTALLGGATATCVRVGDPTFVMPVILGMMVWGGLFFRDPRIRALIPLRSSPVDDTRSQT
jgi:hypothetical protein